MSTSNKRKRVVVAMSGGVDSSVAAALLKEQGHDVIGVTMQIWNNGGDQRPESGDRKSCCALAAVEDARRVANMLDIPYYVMNFADVFQRKVVDDFISEYNLGRTPNPCVKCNQHVKFDALLKKVKELDADYIATGHYAKVEKKGDKYLLKKAEDQNKDQSYALYALDQEVLSQILLPLGDITKQETREIAKKLGFANAQKEESQEICFIPDNDYAGFFKKVSPETVKAGPIMDIQGNIIGMHGGIQFFTIGQRKGMGLSRPEPTYVVKIDQKTNTLIVGGRGDVLGDDLIVSKINWINRDKASSLRKAKVKIRYNSPEAEAEILLLEQGKIRVMFKEPQFAITPGQSAVIYDGDEVVGGGVIEAANK